MIQQIQEEAGISIERYDDLESLFSIEDEPIEKTLCAIPTDFFESESDYLDSLICMTILMLQKQHQTVAKDVVPIPQVLVKIYLDKYSKPITIIVFLDTGAAATIMNPDVLPAHWWKPYTAIFNSAANRLFATYLKSKPITIQFFPRCFV
ncbi:hypothetical protein J1N35_012647 [Gossypium stocksii]|uniref:Uncharacterized protein n=1 Tax=Gossypium stocksii TaxID=47602 RepID=A0A9D3W4A8_9ROSI|nr:hypothetical protein J1N35_012647 [Gossypium stocksii]